MPKVKRTVVNQKLQACGMRAIEAQERLQRVAQRLTEEIDEVTPVHGVPISGLDDEDSMVTSIEAVMSTSASQRPAERPTKPRRQSTKDR